MKKHLRTKEGCNSWAVALALFAAAGAASADDRCLEERLAAAPWGERTRSAWAPAGRFDPTTGRTLLNYPPHPRVEFRDTAIDLTIADMNDPRFDATCVHTIVPIGSPLGVLRLRAGPRLSMTIQEMNTEPHSGATTFVHSDQWLEVTFDPPLLPGVEARVRIDYEVVDPREGMTWTPESSAWPGRPAQLHTQGQPESNRYWFPSHDFPNVRATQTIRAVVPAGFVVSANGRLVSKETVPSGEAWTWRLDQPHVPYLASLVVGKFDVVDLPATRTGVPLQVYAPLGRGGDVARTYGRTAEMIDVFTAFTGHAYPWPRYAQLVVHNFAAGGMENTSATTMYDTAILDQAATQDGDLEGLISHELAHQWFGDLVTCNSWEHIWLNEGFATYLSHVWTQHTRGDDAYLAAMHATRRGLISSDPSDPAPAPDRPGMCSKEYEHAWEVFRRGANPYPKGAYVLHMLREQLGDDSFRAGVKLYLDRFSFKTAETRDLRLALEETSGRSLERFFEQWCMRPGVPRVAVQYSWAPGVSSNGGGGGTSGELVVSATQRQPINAANPAFALEIPVWVEVVGTASPQKFVLRTDSRRGEARFALSSAPTAVWVDPRASVLAELQISGRVNGDPNQMAIAGSTMPTSVTRLDAIDALGKPGANRAGAITTLLDLLNRSEPVYLATAAAASLRALDAGEELLAALRAGIVDARVRAAVIGELAAAAKKSSALRDRSLSAVRPLVQSDPSYAARAAAIRLVGDLGDSESLPAVIAAMNVSSQDDRVRQAAIDALAAIGKPEGLDPVLEAAGPGSLARTRAVAMRSAARMYAVDPARVWSLLTAAIDDREWRTKSSAAEALASLGDERARGLLQAKTASGWGAEAAAARGWLAQLDAAIAQPTTRVATTAPASPMSAAKPAEPATPSAPIAPSTPPSTPAAAPPSAPIAPPAPPAEPPPAKQKKPGWIKPRPLPIGG